MIEISRVDEEELCTENHSWQSPIELIFGQADYHIREMENKVVADIQEQVGIHIDKEGLLKALNGSREQYEKGYAEGREDAYHESIKQLKELEDLKNAIAEVRHKVQYELNCIEYNPTSSGYCELEDGKIKAYEYVLGLINKHIKEV